MTAVIFIVNYLHIIIDLTHTYVRRYINIPIQTYILDLHRIYIHVRIYTCICSMHTNEHIQYVHTHAYTYK